MLNILGCLDRPSAGNYWLGGEDVSQMPDDQLSEARGKKIGFIFQSYNLIAQLTVLENIQVPLFYQGKTSDSPKSAAWNSPSWWGSATGSITGPTSSPAARGSAWPSPGP